MSDPNWEELQEIGQLATRLADSRGRLLPGDYDRLMKRAEKAIGDPKHGRFLEFLLNMNPHPDR